MASQITFQIRDEQPDRLYCNRTGPWSPGTLQTVIGVVENQIVELKKLVLQESIKQERAKLAAAAFEASGDTEEGVPLRGGGSYDEYDPRRYEI